MIKILGISGCLASGKDTLYSLLAQRMNCKRVALADELRREMRPFILDKFNLDLFSCSREEKDSVRPLLVEYARIKRNQTNGRYFINKIDGYVKSLSCNVVITDIRYPEELSWIKELKGILVHITKHKVINGKKVYQKSPILDERLNNPKLKKAADFKIDWPEAADIAELNPYVDKLLAFLERLK